MSSFSSNKINSTVEVTIVCSDNNGVYMDIFIQEFFTAVFHIIVGYKRKHEGGERVAEQENNWCGRRVSKQKTRELMTRDASMIHDNNSDAGMHNNSKCCWRERISEGRGYRNLSYSMSYV